MEEIARYIAQNSYLQAASILVSVFSLIGGMIYLVRNIFRIYNTVVRNGIIKYNNRLKTSLFVLAFHSFENSSVYIALILNQTIWIVIYIFVIIFYIIQISVIFYQATTWNIEELPARWIIYVLVTGIAVSVWRILAKIVFLRRHSAIVFELSRRKYLRKIRSTSRR